MDQNSMKHQVDKHTSEWSFEVSDQVFQWLQPYNKTSLQPQGHQKLALKFYGPYQVIQRIGPINYLCWLLLRSTLSYMSLVSRKLWASSA